MPHSILVADDNSSVRALLVRLIRRAQPEARIIEVDSGQGTLDGYHLHQPMLVLLDHGLPDINGFMVLQQLKVQPNAPYIIVITGDPRLEDEALARGADEVWLKPMDVTALLQHLTTLLPMT